jgi:hypothetical protein
MSDQLIQDWFKGASLIINIDGVLLGFLVLISSGTKSEIGNNTLTLSFGLVTSGIIDVIICVAMFMLVISLIFALVAIFGLRNWRRPITFISAEDMVRMSALSFISELVLLVYLVLLNYFGLSGIFYGSLIIILALFVVYSYMYEPRKTNRISNLVM